jgi:hypothetical protein
MDTRMVFNISCLAESAANATSPAGCSHRASEPFRTRQFLTISSIRVHSSIARFSTKIMRFADACRSDLWIHHLYPYWRRAKRRYVASANASLTRSLNERIAVRITLRASAASRRNPEVDGFGPRKPCGRSLPRPRYAVQLPPGRTLRGTSRRSRRLARRSASAAAALR